MTAFTRGRARRRALRPRDEVDECYTKSVTVSVNIGVKLEHWEIQCGTFVGHTEHDL